MNTEPGHTADLRLSIFIASTSALTSIYLIIAVYLNTFYTPVVDTTPLLPSFRSAFVPELEIPLHHAGFIIITALSTFITFLLGNKIDTITNIPHGLVSSLSATGLAILAVSICWALLAQSYIPAPAMLSVYTATIVLILHGIWRRNPLAFKGILLTGNVIRAISILILMSLLAWVIYSVYATYGVYERMLYRFREDGYPFLDTFTQLHVISAMVAIVGILIATYFEQKKLVRLPHIVRALIHLGFIATIIWLIQILVPSVSYANWGGLSGFSEYLSIIAPVNDVLGGKTLLVNLHSQYGLVMTYILTGIFQVVELTKTNMYYLNLVVHCLGYISIYFLLTKLVKGNILPLASVFFLVMIQQFTYGTNPLFMGQAGYLRYGFWVAMAVFLIVKPSLKWKPALIRATEYILLSIGTFWGFDVGVYFLGGYCVYKTIQTATNPGSLLQKLQNGMMGIVEVILVIAISWILLSSLTYVRAGSWPEWERFTLSVGQFSSGWYMVPMRRFDGHLIVIPLYVLSVAVVTFRTCFNPPESNTAKNALATAGFITTVGILQFSYFLGRSKVGNITVVMAPLVVVSAWLVQQVVTKLIADGVRSFDIQTRIFGTLSAVLGVLLVSIITAAGWVNMAGHIPLHNPAAHNFDYVPPEIQASVDYINSQLGSTHRFDRKIALVSGWDGDILIRTKSTNVIDTNNIEFFILTTQIDELGKQIQERRPEVVYMDAKPDKEKIEMLKAYVIKEYEYVQNIGYLDIWQRKK